MNINELKQQTLFCVNELQVDKLYRLIDPFVKYKGNSTYYIVVKNIRSGDKLLISLYDNNAYQFKEADHAYLYEEVEHELVIKN